MIAQELNYISQNLVSSLDIAEPLWAKKLYDPWGGQNLDLLTMLWEMGAKEAVVNDNGEHWEMDRYMAALTVGANVAAPAAGANLVFTLASAEVDPVTRGSFPIVGNIIRRANGTNAEYVIIGKTDNGTTTTITARPLKATTTQALTAGDKFFIVGVTVPEKSGQQDTQTSFQTAYTWATQNIRTDSSISGNALSTSLKVTQTQGGRTITSFQMLQNMQDEYRHLLALVGSQIYGQITTNTGLTTFSYGTTSGMIEQFTARSVNRQTGGTLGVDDLEAMTEGFAANFAKDNYLALLSLRSYSQISADALTDFNQSNVNAVQNVLSNALFGVSAFTSDQLQATYTFGGLTLNGINFALKRFGLLDDPNGAGVVVDGAERDFGFVWPAGKTKATDATGKEYATNHMMIKYKGNTELNRLMRIWTTGGASPAKNSPVDDFNIHYMTEVGFDFVNLQQTGLLRR